MKIILLPDGQVAGVAEGVDIALEAKKLGGKVIESTAYVRKYTKDEVIARLNTDFDAAMRALHQGWPDYEVQTWTMQAEEAKQWTAASGADKPLTPFLTCLHDQRTALGWDEPFADLVARVVENSERYTQATANCVAVRHFAERDIENAADPSTVKWSF